VGACDKVCFGGSRAVVDKCPVAAFNFGGFELGVTESQKSLSSISSKSSSTSESWSSVSSTSRGFFPTSAWQPGHRL